MTDKTVIKQVGMSTEEAEAAVAEGRAVEGYYVSVMDHGRWGLLLGPYDTHEEALELVETGKRLAEQVNDRAIWYAYGTSKITGPAPLKPGVLNELLEKEEVA